MAPHFVQAEGLIHLISPDEGGERTLCGDAFDLGSDEDGYEWKPTHRRIVDCPKCAAIIKVCRGVRTAPKHPA